jgi:serine/threonine protein kinase HipA of HipAB toxin-antitoxin module
MVLPVKTMILKSMVASDEDEPAVRDVKTAIRVNLEPRYADLGVQDFLHKSTASDARFKSLLHLDAAARLRVTMNSQQRL